MSHKIYLHVRPHTLFWFRMLIKIDSRTHMCYNEEHIFHIRDYIIKNIHHISSIFSAHHLHASWDFFLGLKGVHSFKSEEKASNWRFNLQNLGTKLKMGVLSFMLGYNALSEIKKFQEGGTKLQTVVQNLKWGLTALSGGGVENFRKVNKATKRG